MACPFQHGLLEPRDVRADGRRAAVSKSYAMTGWRIGCAAGPARGDRCRGRLQSHSTSGANSIAQMAALAAITGDQSTVEDDAPGV